MPHTAKEISKKLIKIGFTHSRTRGSHEVYEKEAEFGMITVIVPNHRGDIPIGTFKNILRQARIDEIIFNNL